MSSVSGISPCHHSTHLFENPLCENQSLFKKIANVVFHIFTFGIPLAIYHIFSCCFSKGSPQGSADLRAVGLNSILQNRSTNLCSPLGQEAMEFAKRKLEENPAISPAQFAAGYFQPSETNQPIDQGIAYLTTLYGNLYQNFQNALSQNREDPWSKSEVINAADELMKIAYVIGVLTLEDLRPFTENLASKGENRNYAMALTQQDSYQYRTFYYCSTIYHMLRGAIACVPDPWDQEREILDYPTDDIPATHSNAFYQNGTIQNAWNVLYNEYCDLIRQYVNEEELSSSDPRHVAWTKKDIDASSFCASPSTQPT